MSNPTTPTSTPTTSTDTPTAPPMSPEDARFFAVQSDDEATAFSAWQSVAAQIQAQADTPSGLPNVSLDYAASQLIRLFPKLAALRAPTLALLSPTQAANTAQAIDSLPRLTFALLYVLRQDAKATADTLSLSDLNNEGLTLRDQGLGWCATLENLGKLPAGTAKAIRKGRMSYHETAADLQDLFDALHPHRALIAKLRADAAKPLSDADIDRMARLATLIRALTAQDKAPLAWRVALLRLAHAFARAYHVAHTSAQFYLTLNEDPTYLPTFKALRRPASTPKPPQAPSAPPAPPESGPSA